MTDFGEIFDSLASPVLEQVLGQSIVYYPNGYAAGSPQTLTGTLVDMSGEAGDGLIGQVSGDGNVGDDPFGDRIRLQILIDISADLEIDERVAEWVIDGERYQTVRIAARDENKQSVRLVALIFTTHSTTSKPRLRNDSGRGYR